MLTVTCPQCAHDYDVPESLVNQLTMCPGCGGKSRVHPAKPAPPKPSIDKGPDTVEPGTYSCPYCGTHTKWIITGRRTLLAKIGLALLVPGFLAAFGGLILLLVAAGVAGGGGGTAALVVIALVGIVALFLAASFADQFFLEPTQTCPSCETWLSG